MRIGNPGSEGQAHMHETRPAPTPPAILCRGRSRRVFRLLCALTVALLSLFSDLISSAKATDSFNWNTNQSRVTADIRSGSLVKLLEQIASATGWQVFVEPETLHRVSAKFADLPPGEALRLLLGNVNYALVPGTNGTSKLFVFRTSRQNATRLVEPTAAKDDSKTNAIPNELIVRLKPGAKIDDIARALGAKVVGRIDSLNAYRLQFDDSPATESARQQLSSNPDVASVDNNYSVQPPELAQALPGGASPLQLQLKPPPDNGRIIVGLIDTAVQPLGNNLDQFLLKQLSVTGDITAGGDSPTHGTAMAETILRSLQDMSKGSTSVQILPVNIYPSSGGEPTTTTFDVANGIIAAVNGGAKILNLSLGSPSDSTFLRGVIQDISKLNIPIFAAAGNQPVTTPFYPAAYPGVLAVTAIDQGQLAPYASRGNFISLGAPGTSIVPFGNQSFGVQGTSVSSAFTSGLAAGYMESHGGNTSLTLTFLNSNFGVTITTKGH
jgi:hypothetical protein